MEKTFIICELQEFQRILEETEERKLYAQDAVERGNSHPTESHERD